MNNFFMNLVAISFMVAVLVPAAHSSEIQETAQYNHLKFDKSAVKLKFGEYKSINISFVSTTNARINSEQLRSRTTYSPVKGISIRPFRIRESMRDGTYFYNAELRIQCENRMAKFVLDSSIIKDFNKVNHTNSDKSIVECIPDQHHLSGNPPLSRDQATFIIKRFFDAYKGISTELLKPIISKNFTVQILKEDAVSFASKPMRVNTFIGVTLDDREEKTLKDISFEVKGIDFGHKSQSAKIRVHFLEVYGEDITEDVEGEYFFNVITTSEIPAIESVKKIVWSL